MPIMPPGEWPPSRGRQFCDLTMVERVRDNFPVEENTEDKREAYIQGQVNRMVENEKVITSLDDVLSQDSNIPLKVLIDGVPGVGKSTLVRKSCRDWADGKCLLQFHLVLLVTLKEQEIRRAKAIEELLEADDPSLKVSVMRHIQKTSGKQLLFILDGFDELNEKEKPFFLKLIQGKILHKCSAIVTSRSYAIESYKHEEWIHCHVEILGFTDKQVREYFKQNFIAKNQGKILDSFLKEKLPTTSISYTPLNCSILLYIFLQQKYSFPNTLTELFDMFVLILLNRFSCKSSIGGVLSTSHYSSLSKLPGPMNRQFFMLCKLAYNGMLQGKCLFSSEDISDVCRASMSESIESNLLNLLVSTSSLGAFGLESYYQFLHANIQEYLAAIWIANQSKMEQIAFLRTTWFLPRMRTLLIFYAGRSLETTCRDFIEQTLSGSFLDRVLCHCESECHHCTLLPVSAPVSSTCNSNCVNKSQLKMPEATQAFLNLASMLAEKNDFAIFENIPVQNVRVGYCRLSPLDCSYVAKFLSKCSNHLNSIAFNFVNLTSETLKDFLKISTCGSRLKLCNSVHMNYCASTFSSALELLTKIPWFHQISVLHLQGLKYYCQNFQLHCLLGLENLTNLTITVECISHNNLSEYEKAFIKFTEVLSSNKILETLTYDQNLCGSCESFVQLMSALTHTTVLLTLGSNEIISQNSLTIPDNVCFNVCFRGLASASNVADVRQITSFEIHNKNLFLSCDTCHCLAEFGNSGIDSGNNLQSSLCDNKDNSVNLISMLIAKNKSIRSFDISGCYVTDIVACSIAKGLSKSNTFEEFIMNSHCLTSKGAANILNILDQTKTLKRLSVLDAELAIKYLPYGIKCIWLGHYFVSEPSSNSNPDTAIVLSTFSLTTNIVELELEGIDMTRNKETPGAFKELIKVNQNIKTLRIFYAIGFDDSVAASIADGLTYNDSIYELDLSHNNMSMDGAIHILKALKTNTSLEILNLSSNSFRKSSLSKADVLQTVDEMFKCNKCLMCLYLNDCKINDLFAECIAVGLPRNSSLTVLHLQENCITYSGAMHVFKSLRTNNSLGELDMSFMPLGDISSCVEYKDISFLGTVLNTPLTVNHSLSCLDLQYCKVDDTIADYIAATLYNNNSLKLLGLKGNCITCNGAVQIFKTLEINSGLVELDLSSMELENDTYCDKQLLGNSLEKMLNVNLTLKTLNLGGCNLSEKTSGYIAAGLAKNSCLKILCLSDNNISASGVVRIIQSLECNECLEELYLSSNDFLSVQHNHSDVTVNRYYDKYRLAGAVQRMLAVNRKMQCLDLQYCGLDDTICAQVKTARNNHCKCLF